MIFLILTAAFLITLVSVGAIRDYALSKGIVDKPNHRSSHIEPTPRGGGLAIVLVFLGTFVVLLSTELPGVAALTFVDAIVICLTAGGVALIGWIDDYRSLSPLMRIAAHFLAAAFCVAYFGVPHVSLGPWMIDLGWTGGALATLAMVWCLNLFNFMDGIDGIAAVEAVTVLIGASIVFLISMPGYELIIYLWLLTVVVFGFLIWNWPPAKIFMGDAASGFLGMLLAQFALISSGVGQMMGVNVWCWLILLGVFCVDASMTLVLRTIAGENLLQAHKQHVYQRLARTLQTVESALLSPQASRANAHRGVSLMVAGINLFWLTPLAVLAALWPQAGVFIAAVAMTPLVISTWFAVRHTEAA